MDAQLESGKLCRAEETEQSVKNMASPLTAPFPWFGGKRRASTLVWSRLGDVPNYVEPFAGSLAVLLGRPTRPKIETANDVDRFLVNFWRAVKDNAEAVLCFANTPIFETNMRAQHDWLVTCGLHRLRRLDQDPEDYDPRIAGWWLKGVANWIGGGWCPSGKTARGFLAEEGKRQVAPQNPRLTSYSRVFKISELQSLARRLENVRILCGDWKRVVTSSVTTGFGAVTGVFLDPPYSGDRRTCSVYGHDDFSISESVREWSIANGDNTKMRIALCGYEGEHPMPESWESVAWVAQGGYGNQNSEEKSVSRENRSKERIWFSPHCKKACQRTLF